MRIVILSQSDSIIIPSNIMKLSLLKDVQIIGVYEIISTGSLVNKKHFLLKVSDFFRASKWDTFSLRKIVRPL